MATENKFPTIADLHAVLAELIREGLGELPVQVLVAPDSTMQALSRHAGQRADGKPAIMVEFLAETGRIPVSIMSVDRMDSGPTRRSAVQ